MALVPTESERVMIRMHESSLEVPRSLCESRVVCLHPFFPSKQASRLKGFGDGCATAVVVDDNDSGFLGKTGFNLNLSFSETDLKLEHFNSHIKPRYPFHGGTKAIF